MPSDTPLDASAEPNARPPVDLDRFPRPGVTVDLAVLTVTDAYGEDPQLRLLVQERTDPDGRVAYGAKRFVRPVYDAAMAGAAKRVAAGKDPQPAVLTQLGQWVKRRAA